MITTTLLTGEVVTAIVVVVGTIVTGLITTITKIKTDSNSKEIKSKIDSLSEKVDKNEISLNSLLDTSIIQKSRWEFLKEANEIIADAIKYSNSAKLNNYLIYKGGVIRDTSVNLIFTNPKISDINIELLRGMIYQLTEEINKECENILTKEYAKKMLIASELMIRKMESDVIELINDSVYNSKRRRFFGIMSNFIRNSLSLNIREFNKMH